MNPAVQDGLVVLTPAQLEVIVERAVERALRRSNDTPEWVRGAKAAAEYLGCPESRVYDLVARRELPHGKDGSRLVFRRRDLDDYMEVAAA